MGNVRNLLHASLALAVALLKPSVALAQAARPHPAYQLTYASEFDASFAPDGARFVFVRTIEGRDQLFVRGVDGTAERQISHGEADHGDPAWSPDGKKIAFVLMRDSRKVIYTANPDGSEPRAMTPDRQSAIHPSWSPDSKRLVYCTDDDLRPPEKNESAIYSLEVKTGKIKTLVTGGVNTFPVLSPDGTRLAFRRMVGAMNSEVFVANADGTHPRNLTNHPSFEGWPAWSPDGKQLAFAGNRFSNYQVFLMNADGSDVRLLANTEGRATSPKWSPDGRMIAFTNCQKVDFGRNCLIMAVDLRPSEAAKR